MNATVSARIETLSATAPEGEPIRKPRIAGTIESSIIPSIFAFARVLPRISEAPDATVTFRSSRAPKAASVTSNNALFFRIFRRPVVFVFVMIRIVITPASVAIAMFTFKAAVRKSVIMIGENE